MRLDALQQERAAWDTRLQRTVMFLVRTLPPINLVSFAVVWWFAGRDPRVIALAGLFVLHVLLTLRGRVRMTLWRLVWALFVNLVIFTTAALLAGSNSPGWLLFIPPLLPATVVLRRFRYPITIGINATCLVVNIVVQQPLSMIVAVSVAFAALSAILLRITDYLHLQEQEIERERARSDELLGMVLPTSISKRIKAGETYIAERHEDVSVLFAERIGDTIRENVGSRR